MILEQSILGVLVVIYSNPVVTVGAAVITAYKHHYEIRGVVMPVWRFLPDLRIRPVKL